MWVAKEGYKFTNTIYGFGMYQCVADLCTAPIIIDGSHEVNIVGGMLVAAEAANGGSYWTTSRANKAIWIKNGSRNNSISNVYIRSGGSGIVIDPDCYDNAITGNKFEDIGRGPEEDWCAAIWDGGDRTKSTANNLDTGGNAGAQGIVTTGDDSEHSLFTCTRIGSSASEVYDAGTRSIFNGMSRNAGNPASSGNWNGHTKVGTMVYDTVNDKVYVGRLSNEYSVGWEALS